MVISNSIYQDTFFLTKRLDAEWESALLANVVLFATGHFLDVYSQDGSPQLYVWGVGRLCIVETYIEGLFTAGGVQVIDDFIPIFKFDRDRHLKSLEVSEAQTLQVHLSMVI